MEVFKERFLYEYPSIIPYDCSKKIFEQMEKNICKIKSEKEIGTGFFCKIPLSNNKKFLPLLITDSHIINKDLLNTKDAKINIKIEEDKNERAIDLNDRLKYLNEKYNITIIELKERDNITNFIELDEGIINNIINEDNLNKKYINETIYMIQYPEGKLSVSYGIIENIFENNKYMFRHKCNANNGSSGSPILNIKNKIIGIHKGGYFNKYNTGTFLNYPIKEFLQQYCNNNQLNVVIDTTSNEVDTKRIVAPIETAQNNEAFNFNDINNINIHNDMKIYNQNNFIKSTELRLPSNLQDISFDNLKNE